MIKKIKSRLSVKIFLIVVFIAIGCCIATYVGIGLFAPYVYIHSIEEVEQIAESEAYGLSVIRREDAALPIAYANNMLSDGYDEEYVLHLFQSSGEELSLPYLNSTTGKRIEDFENIEKTAQYEFSFIGETEKCVLFISKNIEKENQVVEALHKALPSLSVIMLIISLCVAFFFSWYVTAPIKKISRISKQIADMDFSGLCPTGRSDEIGILATSLNELSGKLTTALADLQNANQKLQEDIDKERRLEQQRLEFFSAASHELKTPITIIKGQLQGMLYQVGRYKDRETYLGQALEVTGTLEQMVQELLTVARLDTPGYVCSKNEFDLGQLLNERLMAYDELLAQKEQSLEKVISGPVSLLGDRILLQKVLDNLLSNAINYSPVGSKIFVRLCAEAERIIFSIENTGIHIPQESISRLFEAFYRVDQSRNRQTGGSGLGLYIVKTILDLHGATVQIANSCEGVIVTVIF